MSDPAELERITHQIEDGETPWPRDGRFRAIVTDEDTFVGLLSGRQRFLPFYGGTDYDPEPVEVGDVLIIRTPDGLPVGPRRVGLGWFERQTFMVTHLWAHDGIAPGWAIASVRRVLLAAAPD